MNYIKHLTGFFEKVTNDKTLNPTHISLYIALFQFWNCNRFKNPISISRDEVMRISKISSKATYHKCLKGLHSQGYIKYEPSYNPFKGSHVFLFNFSDDLKPLSKSERAAIPNFNPVSEQALNRSDTGNGTTTALAGEQAIVSYINNTNNTNSQNTLNSVNLGKQAKKIENEVSILNQRSAKEEKSCDKKEEKLLSDLSSTAQSKGKNPTIEEVLTYFREQDFPELEANKFFNYFKSVGWLVGGKTPMADWPAAARNWMLNVPKFISNERTDTRKQFDTSADKDYSEPL